MPRKTSSVVRDLYYSIGGVVVKDQTFRQSEGRRQNPRLRGVFEQSYNIAFPLLDPKRP